VRTDVIRGHLESLLLAVLAEESGHGYALCRRLAERSGGELTVPEGSLYPALQRLEQRGLVTSSWSTASGRRRRVYELAPAGRIEASRSAQAWRRFSGAVDRVIGGFA
jgi:PadR family transcriptional regulator PadR